MVSKSLLIAPLGAVVVWSGAGAAQAQAAPPDERDTPVSPLVVVATRIPTRIDQLASAVTLITDHDIADHQWRSLPDALAAVPGLSVVQTGGPGGQTSVFIRGANANHTKVLIDGIDVDDPSEGEFDFGRALTDGLSRVEVLRGPQSSLYGSDALGGVINIVTREGKGPARLDASVEGGSFDTLSESAGISGSTRGFSYTVDVAHSFSGNTPITPLGLLAQGEHRIGDRYDNLTAGTKLSLAVTKDLSLGLIVRYVDDDLKFTGENYNLYPAPDAPDAAQTDQRGRQLFVRAETRHSLLDGRVHNTFGVGYTDYHTLTQSPDDGIGVPAPVLAAGNRLKIDDQVTVALPGHNTLVLGAEDEEDRLLASPVDASDGSRAGYVEWLSQPFAGVNLAASVRYDDDDRFGDWTTWHLGPTWLISGTGTQLKATVGTGFKAPTLTQLFVSYPSFGYSANANLRPEASTGYDLGFEQPLAEGRVRLGATWFHNAIRNLIEDNADFSSEINLGRATTYGVESFVSFAISPRLDLRADYTDTIARDDIHQQELLRRPKAKASLLAAWRPTDRLALSASLLYVGGWVDGNRDFSISRLPASPYAVTNLAASYDIGRGVTLFARIDNLLDRHFQDPVGFDKPGIGAFGGVRVNLYGSGQARAP